MRFDVRCWRWTWRSSPRCAGMSLPRRAIDYAAKHTSPSRRASPYSIDQNLFGRSCEAGVLEDPWNSRRRRRSPGPSRPREAPDDRDVDHRLRGRQAGGDRRPADGRGAADRQAQRARRRARRRPHRPRREPARRASSPASCTRRRRRSSCTSAPRTRRLTLSREQLRFNRFVADELARLIYDGLWFSALSRDLRGYVASSQRVVSGEVRIRLDHGQAIVAGRRYAAVALRQVAGHVRRGRRLRPRIGGRLHRDLRAAAAG